LRTLLLSLVPPLVHIRPLDYPHQLSILNEKTHGWTLSSNMTILMTLKALCSRGSLSRWFTYNRFILIVLSCIGVRSDIGLSWTPILLLGFRNEYVFQRGFK